jgi:hypothetical protein
MKNFTPLVCCLALAPVLMPATASAGDEWQFRITPYLWFAGVKGEASTIPGAPVAPIDVSSSQALEDTEASFMGVFEVKKGKHGGFLDVLYSDVQSDTALIPAPIGLTLRTTSKSTLVTAAYAYELYNRDQGSVDVFGGARYWEVDTQLDFGGGLGLLAGRTIRNKEDWVDPLIGIKASSALGGSKFFVSGILGVGGFGVGSDNFYDASADIGYQWNKTIGTTLGYRVFDVKYEDGTFFYDVRQEGWLLGVSFAF